ncbi:MAG: biotin/lipoate A/B protein ligase family protein [Prevotella sp.]
MIYLDLPDKQVRRLSFYLSMEEFAARHIGTDEDLFFMWQVNPTVIFGRNQVIENEVNIEYCTKRGIEMYRRKSGGGCVYADMSNVMLSYITLDANVDETFGRYLDMVTEALRTLGIEAVKSDHNDIMIGEKKVSGNAIYHLPGKNIAHGTLLYDTDMENMLQAITPSKQKLSKHGVESVRQRICLLKDYTSFSFPEIRRRLREYLCSSQYTLTPADIQIIEEIEKEYLDRDFIFGTKQL